MADAALKELMARLHAALSTVDQADAELMSLVRDLEGDIHRLLVADATAASHRSVVDRAAALETRFATDHPRAEQVLREIVDALGKMGV